MLFFLRDVFGERSVSKLAGLFDARPEAEEAATYLADVAGLRVTQLRVLGPEDAKRSHRNLFGRAVEPEDAGIGRTIVRTHLAGSVVGAVLGMVLFAVLFFSEVPMIAASPVAAFLVLTGFATTFGLLVAGLLSLRPDHALMIDELRSALRARRWALVVHPTSAQQFDAAKSALQSSGAKVLTTL